MPQVLQGVISSSDGLREVLEIIVTLKHVNSGVLQINCGENSGRVGVAWGRFITGALMDNGLTGKVAVRDLLSVREGRFAFIDTEGEPVPELRQSLGIDLNGVVMSVPNLTPQSTPWLFEQAELMEAFMRSSAATTESPKIASTEPHMGETPASASVSAEIADAAAESTPVTSVAAEETNGSAAQTAAEYAAAAPPQVITGVDQNDWEITISDVDEIKSVKTEALAAASANGLGDEAFARSLEDSDSHLRALPADMPQPPPNQQSFHTQFDLNPSLDQSATGAQGLVVQTAPIDLELLSELQSGTVNLPFQGALTADPVGLNESSLQAMPGNRSDSDSALGLATAAEASAQSAFEAEAQGADRASFISELDSIAPHMMAGQPAPARSTSAPPPTVLRNVRDVEDEEAAETLRLAKAAETSALVAKQQQVFQKAMQQAQQEQAAQEFDVDQFYGTDPTTLRRSNQANARQKIDISLATDDLRVQALRPAQPDDLMPSTPARRERQGPNVSKLRTKPANNSMTIALICIIFFLLSCAVTVFLGPKLLTQITNSAPLAQKDK